jgi:hypothetical protein
MGRARTQKPHGRVQQKRRSEFHAPVPRRVNKKPRCFYRGKLGVLFL